MNVSLKRAVGVSMIAFALLGFAACSSDSKTATSSSSSTGSSSSAVDLTAASFTADFSAMQQLKDLAAKGKGLIGVLLPDTTSSARYEAFDRPYLTQAFQAAGLSSSDFKVDNAQGSATTMQTQAEADITQGASVLLIDALDSGSGAAIEANAASKGVAVIDYDRLVKGGADGRTYVSFDNVSVGKLIGQGEVDCIAAWKVAKPNILVMDGDPTDNNATLFAEGYNGVLKSHFDDGSYVKVGEPAGTWTPAIAATTFEQQYTAHPAINAVITPNDDNANAVIAQLQKLNIPAKTFPTTGQDASLSGLQNILKGFQCGTVYKAVYQEAQAAVAVALYVRASQTPPAGLVNGKTTDSQANKDVPSVLLTPVWVTADNMASTVVSDKAVKTSDLCITAVADTCTAAGIKVELTPIDQVADPLLALRGIEKHFGAVQALVGVDLDIPAGQVTALAGDNGAGKSVLIKCIAGIHTPDAGEIVWDGKPVHIRTPRDAAALGIETVHQDLALCDNLDIVQNMFLGRESVRHLALAEEQMEKAAGETLSSLAVTTVRSIRQPVASLSGGQRQSVAIAKAVLWNSKLVVMDEPTAALGLAETAMVLELVRRLADRGLAVLLVSHNLNDVFEVADRIAVLYLGRLAAVRPTSELDRQSVVDLVTTGESSR